jgi:acetylornithine/N-succinyldiaminopimelate aminotransferase
MERLFVNTYKKRPIIVNGGLKSYLYVNKNNRYIDFLSGISINNIGYGNKKIIQKILCQAEKIIHPSNYYYTKIQLELAKKLTDISGLDRVFFSNSGAEANEAAFVFLSKYRKKKFPHRNEVIVFDGSFLGRTYGCKRIAAGQSLGELKIKKVPFNNLSAFKLKVNDNTLAVHLELVLGHGGIKPMDFYVVNQIVEICKKKNILICIDEIQTGLGRVGSDFAFKLYGLNPDIITLGKSLGGGIPLSATLVKERVAINIEAGDHGSTMGGNSLACAASGVIIDFISHPKNIQRINEKGRYIIQKINALKGRYPFIKEVRGLGLMIGVELKEKADLVLAGCIENGLLIDVVNKNTLRFLPPFNISKKDIDLAIDKLTLSLLKCL